MDAEIIYSLVIAEELALIRDGIARLCETTGWFNSIDCCGDAPAALELIQTKAPSLILIDFQLPRMFSLELVRRIRESGSLSRILIMSAKGDRKLALEALRSGANGFVLKSSPATELLEAINRVLQGSLYVSPVLQFEKVFMSPTRHSEISDPVEQLSSREYQVFQLLIEGVRAKEIASRLSLSPKTVDTYRASLMRKLDIHDLAGLVKFAIQRELIST
jgi:DNA-binding NarL/FixJ family response regulator